MRILVVALSVSLLASTALAQPTTCDNCSGKTVADTQWTVDLKKGASNLSSEEHTWASFFAMHCSRQMYPANMQKCFKAEIKYRQNNYKQFWSVADARLTPTVPTAQPTP